MRAVRTVLVAFVLLLPVAVFADGSIIYLSPETGNYSIGDTFQESVNIDTGTGTVNAGEADIAFDTTALEVEGISIDGSICDSWPTPPKFSNTAGTISFTCSINDSYTGDSGEFATITFKALSDANTDIRLTGGSALEKGDSSNILSNMQSASITIAPTSYVPSKDTTDVQVATTTATSTPEASAPPITPSFTDYAPNIQAGQYIVVKGSASPDAIIVISLQKDDGDPVQSTVASGADGSFTFASDQGAEPGTYTLSAQTKTPDGQISDQSERITIVVSQADLLASAGLIGTVASDMLPYAAFAILMIAIIGYLRHRRKYHTFRQQS
ncbi:MAG TPA: cohesin domain-containing protein [Candidatus Paceibacterota bacterium]|nr:cohesin domain-containing protein [Candidatus Paceibacterota bacterium]